MVDCISLKQNLLPTLLDTIMTDSPEKVEDNLEDIYLLTKYDWRFKLLIHICSLEFNNLDKKASILRNKTHEILVTNRNSDLFVANFAVLILRRLNINIKTMFSFCD